MNLQIVSLIFCHSALQMLFDHYLSYTLLKLIEFCQVETSIVHVRAVAAAYALNKVMCYHQKLLLASVGLSLESLALKKTSILNDVLMLYILFANLLGCHSVLLMHFVHP